MEPVYEYRDESPTFKWLIIFTSVLMIAMAIFTPLEGDEPLWLVIGLKAMLFVFGVGIFGVIPSIHVKAFPDYIEVTYGMLKLIKFRLDIGNITDVKPITYSPMRDFGGWGIKGGYGKWGGWWAFTVTGSKHVLGIETTEKNYILSCPDPEYATVQLKNNFGFK